MNVDQLMYELSDIKMRLYRDRQFDKANEVQYIISYLDNVIEEMSTEEGYEDEWDHTGDLGHGVLW